MSDSQKERPNAGIAIVGMAGRFPGARTVKEFWRNLVSGVESIAFATEEEISAAGIDPALAANKDFVPASSVVHEPEFFDASFFGFSAREAEIIDPQQRIFLECAWEALEDAACDASSYPGAIGVFAGAGMNSYGVANLFSNPEIIESVGAYQVMVGNDKDFLCSRVSYKLNLRGPSVAVQTACSTSLVAVQMAFESLLRNECDMALAGGVSILLPQPSGYLYVPGMIFSRDGHCRAFDAEASGIVSGAGAGVVVLKRLDDAIADGDHIYAVLRGAAINNDGSSKVGYSAPSVEGQAAVIRKSMQMAGFTPESIGYVEAHGTGTEMGDPIEVSALQKAFESTEMRSKSCALGSVKTNVGHLDTAAGVTGLIKTALALQHREIPATLHFTRANPLIDFSKTPFYVNSSLVPFTETRPFRAGVSSFGIGGTNAHVSLEEAPPVQSDALTASQLFVLSAKTATALDKQATQLLSYLDENPSANLADVAFTLQEGRQAFLHRRVLVSIDMEKLKAGLQSSHRPSGQQQLRNDNVPSDALEVVFLFPGQGSQYVNMGNDLYRSSPVFRDTVDHCCEILAPHLNLDLRAILYPAEGGETEAERLLGQTAITQPALFVIEYAMAKLWMDCGIRPAGMVGHSIGEYVAACIAGVFSLEDALTLIATRGRMIQSAPKGAMLAVSLSDRDLEPLLSREVSVAAINSPGQTVASGPEAEIAALEATLQNKKIECKRLRTSHAFHSPMMDSVVEEFVRHVTTVKLHAPKMRYVSNVTGTWIANQQASNPEYWGSHLRNTVRFADCVRNLIQNSDNALLEVGPGDTLLSLVRAQLKPRSTRALIASMRHRLVTGDDHETWLAAVGRMWLLNARLHWDGLHRGERRARLSLPTYPFVRQRYWVEPKKAQAARPTIAPEKQSDIADWFYVPSWKRSVSEPLLKSEIDASDTWLLLAEDGSLAIALEEGLSGRGSMVRVRTADKYSKVSPELYEIDPANRQDCDTLMRELDASGRWPRRIVHAWMSNSNNAAHLDRALDTGLFSAMFLVQAVLERSSTKSIEFTTISDRAYSIFGEHVSSPTSSALNAFCSVVALECSNITCRAVDIDSSADVQTAMKQLIKELASVAFNEIVAYRGSARWVQQYEPVRLEKPAPPDEKSGTNPSRVSLRSGGTYLVTGGLGGVGLVLARHIARSANVRIILTSRTAFPAASEWGTLLERSETPEALKRKIQGVQSIQEAGGEVLVLNVDATDRNAMRQVLSQWSPINGIVHAAGVAGSGMVQTASREQALAVLAPKIYGTVWIRECLGNTGLDFVLLCSSISATIASFGLSDYSAGNAYLDGFAAELDDPSGTRVISANWDTWREVGMAVDASVPAALPHLREDRLKHGIRSAEAEEVFNRLLHSPMPQVLISTRDFTLLKRQTAEAIAQLHGTIEFSTSDLAMAAHSRPESLEDFSAAEDEIELFIVNLWQELLGIEPIGIHDNFFKLGGHSLLGTRVLARMRERFKIELSLRTIFEAVTPAELAQHVRLMQRKPELIEEIQCSKVSSHSGPLVPMERNGRIPQTHAQQGMWLIDYFTPGNVAYNIPEAFRINGKFNSDTFQKAVYGLLARHETLRTFFYEDNGELLQSVSADATAAIGFTDLSMHAESDRERTLSRLIRERAREPFDLSRAPLLRFHLFKFADEQHVIFFNIHHIVADRSSLAILQDELTALYQAALKNETANLPILPVQYADYAIWAERYLADGGMENHIRYWSKKLAGAPPHLELRCSRPYPEERTAWGETVLVLIPESIENALSEIAKTECATMFMTLLTAFAVLLYMNSGQEDFCVGSPFTHRNQVETEPLIGLFLNMLVLRCELVGDPSFRELLARVRTTALEAYEHSDMPFQELVRALKPDLRSRRSPLFQMMFGYDSEVQSGQSSFIPVDTNPGTAKFDLALQLREGPNGVVGGFEYRTDLFDSASIEKLAKQFVTLLGQICQNPNLPISSLGSLKIDDSFVPQLVPQSTVQPNRKSFWSGGIRKWADRLSPRAENN